MAKSLMCGLGQGYWVRETHFNARLDMNNARLDIKSRQSHSSTKSRSRALGHYASLKTISWTITMQGLTLAAIIVTGKST